LFLYDTHKRWLDYLDVKTLKIFSNQREAEQYTRVHRGLWLIYQVLGPYGLLHWRTIKVKPVYEQIVRKEAHLMQESLNSKMRKAQ
jgi:hypothetical protein